MICKSFFTIKQGFVMNRIKIAPSAADETDLDPDDSKDKRTRGRYRERVLRSVRDRGKAPEGDLRDLPARRGARRRVHRYAERSRADDVVAQRRFAARDLTGCDTLLHFRLIF